MCDETPQERQDNEIEALKAIFGDQIEDKRAAIAWKVWRPLDLLLTLHPLHSSSAPGVHCSVTLHIRCCTDYPNKPPKITIQKLHGLSNENGAKLIVELEELTKKLCGEVMIFEVAQHVQSFLHTFNKPTLSFYDEMLERRNELERLKQHDLQVKENEERLKIKSEIQRRQEILKAAPRRTHRTSISQEESPPEDRGDAPNLVLYYSDHKVSVTKKSQTSRQSLPCNCTCKGIQILRLTQRNNKKIHVGKCIDHSSTGSTTYLAIDADTGESLITKKWTLNPATDFQMRNKKINAIEQDFKSICKLKNQALIPYTVLEIQQESLKRTTVQCVYLVREFVLGSSLKFLWTKVGVGDSFDALRLLRHIAIGVFGALNELHSVGVLHRDVTSENVFLDSDGKVKLVGAALDVRLMEVMESESYCDSQTKGQDILAAACMLLLIISPKNPPNEIPSHLPSTARDFFSRCLTEDEHLQWSAKQLLNHCFLLDAPSVNPESKQQDDGYSGSEDEERELARSFVSHTLPTSGHSRLSAEFEVLKWLGKGAFGDVLKVKNKLDGGFYALKRIKLNPENVNLNKKITREVKLLSRLNHENVVRYYNAWIETIEANLEASGSSEISVVEKNLVTPSRPAKTLPPNSMEALAAKLAPGVKLEWSISESPIVKRDNNPDSDSSEDVDDEDDGWFKRLPKTTALDDEMSSSIEFECENGNQSQSLPSDEPDSTRTENERIQQVLYIQMEFCEKSTLRQAIDNGLYKESYRVWRLFREIVNGLNHVHQRGMIHRDLKPVNIFLDSNDHVKIGDFGLATKAFGAPQLLDDKAKVPEEFGGSLTGQVGTALYVAPELLQAGNKVIYNQKVDIYSLGIILFEMFHPPLDTGMERMKVLTELRSKDIVMPAKFATEDNAKQIHLIRWLLTHEPSNRPTCTELLTSEHVPRPVQEGALSALISHTLTAKPNRSYQLLVNACMEQRISPAEDYTYHSGLRTKPDAVFAALKEILIEVFKIHGATEFSPPLLVPRAKIWDQYPNAVKVMTAFGSVCHLPHDLRLPFARHVAYTETKWLRRYVIDRVFREKQVEGFHPREMLECAFDIVTPKTGSLWPDAETLVVAAKAAAQANLRVAITLNHTEILRIVLLCCGVPVDRHKDLYPILVDVRLGRITNLQLQTHLTSLCITTRDIANLLRLMDSEVAIAEVQDLLGPFTKKAEWSRTLRRAIADLVAVSEIAKGFGLECTVLVAPCLAYNATQHAGVFWQMAVLREYRKHRSGDVIAVGGRYDALVEEFWRVARTEKDGAENLTSSSVGFSMSLERMANIIRKMDDELKSPAFTEQSTKIGVCISVPPSTLESSTSSATWSLAREVWGTAIQGGVALCDGTAADARERTAATLVLADDGGAVRATHWDDNRVREHRIAFIDVVDFLKQKLNPESTKVNEGYNRLVSWSDSEKASGPNISVTFIKSNDKMSKNSRRQCENQISTQLSSSLSRLGVSSGYSRWRACVVAALCEGAALRALATVLGERAQLLHDVAEVYERFPKRRKILEEIISELQALASNSINQSRSSDDPVIFALYSIPDSMLKILI